MMGIVFGMSAAAGAQQPSVERGKYLVGIRRATKSPPTRPRSRAWTPPARALSGRPSTTALPSATTTEVHASLDFTAFVGPWGQTVASNLTPDEATGIGNRYSEATFIMAMRTGKKPNGTPIMPPMSSDVYKNMTHDDLNPSPPTLRTLKPIPERGLRRTDLAGRQARTRGHAETVTAVQAVGRPARAEGGRSPPSRQFGRLGVDLRHSRTCLTATEPTATTGTAKKIRPPRRRVPLLPARQESPPVDGDARRAPTGADR